MKHAFYLFTFIFLAHAAFSQTSGDEQEIRQVLSRQQAAWNTGNLEEFMQGYWKSDSLKFIGKKGITYGWQQTLDNYKKSYPDKASMGELQFEILSIELLSAKNALLVGKWMLKREKDKGDIGGHFTLQFKKIMKHWVIVLDHTS